MTLEESLRATVREAVAEALAEIEWPAPEPQGEEEGWRSRIHRVHEDTRLSLDEVAEALDVSTRTVRRHLAGEGDHPVLPHDRGPTGLTVRAGELLRWIQNVEDGEAWKGRRAS